MNWLANIRTTSAITALLSACTLWSGSTPSIARHVTVLNRSVAPDAVSQPEPPPLGHAYLVRGILGLLFSRGMNGLAEHLQQDGVTADVYDFTSCDTVAETALKDYYEAPAPIALIGHSMGGRCVLQVASKLRDAHIPVSLLVTVDPVHASPGVPANVERYINIFLSDSLLGGGDVRSEQGYPGHYASFDLATHADVSHITIDKLAIIHDQLIAKIVRLSVTPSKAEGEAAPLHYVVPPDTPIELWDSGIPVFVRPGDTLRTITEAHRVPLWSITQINPGISDQNLVPGERIIVPRHLLPTNAIPRPPQSRR